MKRIHPIIAIASIALAILLSGCSASEKKAAAQAALDIAGARASALARNVNPNTARYAAANDTLGTPAVARAVLYGDSITDAWPGKRPEFFAPNGIVGRGISGQTSYQFVLRFGADVIGIAPEVVVINYGTNDIAQNSGPYVEEETFRNVRAMCAMAKSAGIKVILASTLPHKGFGWRPEVTDAMPKVVHLNSLVKAFAEENGIPYVDYYSSMVSEDGTRMRPELSGDGVHPNADGYAIMESLVLPVINSLR